MYEQNNPKTIALISTKLKRRINMDKISKLMEWWPEKSIYCWCAGLQPSERPIFDKYWQYWPNFMKIWDIAKSLVSAWYMHFGWTIFCTLVLWDLELIRSLAFSDIRISHQMLLCLFSPLNNIAVSDFSMSFTVYQWAPIWLLVRKDSTSIPMTRDQSPLPLAQWI